MALTKVSSISNSVQVDYRRGYFLAAGGKEIWARFVDWEPISEGKGGSSFDFLAYEELPVALTALTEDSDVVPVAMTDDNLAVTPAEYGNSVAPTRKARWQARANLVQAAGEAVGQNRARSVDRLIRNGVLGGSNVRYPGTCVTRTDLDATSDKVSYAFLLQLEADAIVAGIEPFEGAGFISPVHPLLFADILQLTQITSQSYYREDNEFLSKAMGAQKVKLGGFTFFPHKWGKVYLSGGTTLQAATTLTAAAAAGATTLAVTDGTGLSNGNYITVGTLEDAGAEQVLITSGGGTTSLTIQGGGNGPGNLGLRYAHASGAAVTEAANVCAIPVIGKNSIKGVYGDVTGRYGQPILKEGLDLLNRFVYKSWYWYGGVGVWDRYMIRGEVAVSSGIRGGE